jgi:hypothetical protein
VSNKKFLVVEEKSEGSLMGLKTVGRYYFSDHLEKIEKNNYKLYYRKKDRILVEYLANLLQNYLDMPEKIAEY